VRAMQIIEENQTHVQLSGITGDAESPQTQQV
jgi:hypothetical protein